MAYQDHPTGLKLHFRSASKRQIFGVALGVGALAAGACYWLRYPREGGAGDETLFGKTANAISVSEGCTPVLPNLPLTILSLPANPDTYLIGENGDDRESPPVIADFPQKLATLLFSSPNVAIKDQVNVRRIVQAMIEDGDYRLQIVTHFDNTLSRFAKNGAPCDRVHQVLGRCPRMGKEYKEMVEILRLTHEPLQQDSGATAEKREEGMKTWLVQLHELMRRFDVRTQDIREAVEQSNAMPRARAPIFLSKVGLRKVPVTIYSSGLTLVVREILENQVSLSDNVLIIANELLSGLERLSDVREQLVCGSNMRRKTASRAQYLAQYKRRDNIIVLGDNALNDADIISSALVENARNILKIGFLVQDFDQNIELFKEAFDIVVVDQESFTIVHDLVEYIMGAPNKVSTVWELERLDRTRSLQKLW